MYINMYIYKLPGIPKRRTCRGDLIVAAQTMTSNWRTFGTLAGYTEEQLIAVEAEGRNTNEDRCSYDINYRILLRWFNEHNESPLTDFINILRNARCSASANEVINRSKNRMGKYRIYKHKYNFID